MLEKAGVNVGMEELVVETTMENMNFVLSFIEKAAEDAGCPEKQRKQLILSLEEIYVNIVNYAYKEQMGECRIFYEVIETKQGLRIVVKDRGVPFNPLEKENPKLTDSVEEKPIGGLGIYMVRQNMDTIQYHYENGENVLIMEKLWSVK